MNKPSLLQSKAAAWTALALVLALIVLTFRLRCAWWSCIDMFFAFMMVFSHLAAIYIGRYNGRASRKLDLVALWCGILTVVAIIGEYIAYTLTF